MNIKTGQWDLKGVLEVKMLRFGALSRDEARKVIVDLSDAYDVPPPMVSDEHPVSSEASGHICQQYTPHTHTVHLCAAAPFVEVLKVFYKHLAQMKPSEYSAQSVKREPHEFAERMMKELTK